MSSASAPRLILLIRHAEKPEDRHDPNLSSRGYSRAGALPAWLACTYEKPVAIYAMRSGSVPDVDQLSSAVVGGGRVEGRAAGKVAGKDEGRASKVEGKDDAKDDGDKKTRRPIQTITPYATQCGVHLNTGYGFGETSQLVRELMNTPAYAGRLVVVCWVHGEIPLIARELGCEGHLAWSGTDYDHIWSVVPRGSVVDARPVFGRDRSSAVVTGPSLSVVPQRLLFGDGHH
jgi:hypothetical protein